MTHPAFAPLARDARTYSCSRRDRICPRIRRDMDTQYNRAKMINSEIMLEPIFSRTVPSSALPSGSLRTDASRMTISMSGRE